MGKHSILEQLQQIKRLSVDRYGDAGFAAEIFQAAVLQMFAVMPEDQQILVKQYMSGVVSDSAVDQDV